MPEVRNLVHFDALCWWWSTAEHVPRLVSGGSASRVHARLLSSYQETVQNIAAARKKVWTTVPFNWVYKGSIYQRLIVKIWAPPFRFSEKLGICRNRSEPLPPPEKKLSQNEPIILLFNMGTPLVWCELVSSGIVWSGLVWYCMVWSCLEKSFTYGFDHLDAANSHVLADKAILAWWRTNNQVNLKDACSGPLRTQSFAIPYI